MPATPLLGQLMPFAGNFAPRGWAFCQGQLLPIAQSTALFSILGTTYGGNGTTNFALPDLRGRTPIHMGDGPGLESYDLGEQDGVESVTLNGNQLGNHSHALPALAASATASLPTNAALAEAHGAGRGGGFLINRYTTAATPATTLSPQGLALTGGTSAHNNLQPLLVISWCIALQGIFPARN
jgi:microcystin-dependent protein